MSEVDGPTPQTVAKLMTPTVHRLFNEERIGATEFKAANEIERVWTYLTSALAVRAMSYGDAISRSVSSSDPGWFLAAYPERYRPWANEMTRLKKSKNDRRWDVVMDVLFSRQTIREIERARGLKNGSAVKLFISALRDYSRLAGWD